MRGRAVAATIALRRQLTESLFVAAPERPRRFGKGQTAILIAAFLVLACVLQLFRIGPRTALDSLWAEDGPIFLQGAMYDSFFHNLFQTYAGYLVVVPRLIGEVGNAMPLRDAAAGVAATSVLVVAISGLAVWYAAEATIRNPWLRGCLVALTVLCPVASLESIASGSYVLWYMLFASFWLLVWRPRSDWSAALGAVFILLTALSTPEIWFFAPLALLRALTIRDRRDGMLVGAWLLGSIVQVPAYALSDETQVAPLWSHDIVTAFLQRVLDGAALGERLGGAAWETFGWALLIVLLVAAVVGVFVGLRRSDAAARWLVGVAILVAVAMFVVSVYQRAVSPQMIWPGGTYFGDGGRYTIVPALLLLSAALVMIDRALRRGTPRITALQPWLVGGVVAFLLVGLAISFDVREVAARGTPPWRTGLEAATAQCEAEPAPEVSVPISPPPFSVAVRCDELISD